MNNNSPINHTDERLMQLEIKASYTEDLLDTLNQIVARQQQQIDRLVREVGLLRQQMADSSTPTFRSLRDEAPPHY
jgi:SlyX protein